MKKNLLYLSFLFLVVIFGFFGCCKEEDELSMLCRQFYDKKGPQFFESAKVGTKDTTYSFIISSTETSAKIVIFVDGPYIMENNLFFMKRFASFTESYVFKNNGYCDAWSLVSYAFEDNIDHSQDYSTRDTEKLVDEKKRIIKKLITLTNKIE